MIFHYPGNQDCRRTNLLQKLWIWRQLEAYWLSNNALKTSWDHQIIFLDLPFTMTIHLGNTPINFICQRGMVTLFHCSYFQELLRFTTILHLTWHTVPNEVLVSTKDYEVMVHSYKDMTSTNAAMAGLKCSSLFSFQDYGHHLLAHQKCLLDHWEMMQSVGQHTPALLLHQIHLPAYQGGPPPQASQ